MSESHSDQYDMAGYQDVPMMEPEREATGRTFWDLLSGKGLILLAVAVCAVIAALVLINRDSIDWQAVLEFLKEYWYVAIGPVLGLILGSWFAKLVHQPITRVILSLDVDTHTVQALVVPENFFRILNQTGNNVVYHSPSGVPVYLANSVDLERAFVDYGWVHEHDALVVFTKERFYTEWKDTLDQAMADNLNLMDNPEVYGMQFAGEALKRHLDRVASAVGVGKENSGGPSDYHGRQKDERDAPEASVIPEDGSSGGMA